MRKLFLSIVMFMSTGIAIVCNGQYIGGIANPSSSNSFTASVCAIAANTNIYFGGVQDGYASGVLAVSACPVPQNANIYFGGVQDGFASGSLAVSVCPVPQNTNIYFGGVEDGFASGALAVSVCPIPQNTNIYFGGIEDGFASGNLAVSVCPVPVNTNIYFGGIQDGFASGALTASVCPIPVNANIYFGGVQDGFSSVVLSGPTNPCVLSISLVSFAGTCVNQSKVLTWNTAAEDNNDFFTIEYSPDGSNWQNAGTVAGAGNSSVTLYYSFTDPATRTGTAYYRLKQTDRDGKFTISGIISIGACGPDYTDRLNVYPNPSPGTLLLSYDGDKSKVQSIDIYDAAGLKIYSTRSFQQAIDLGNEPSGTYFVYFTTDTRTMIKEVLIQKQ